MTCVHKDDHKSKLTCTLEADESKRLRMERIEPRIHQDRVAEKGDNSLHHYTLIHKFIPILQAMIRGYQIWCVDTRYHRWNTVTLKFPVNVAYWATMLRDSLSKVSDEIQVTWKIPALRRHRCLVASSERQGTWSDGTLVLLVLAYLCLGFSPFLWWCPRHLWQNLCRMFVSMLCLYSSNEQCLSLLAFSVAVLTTCMQCMAKVKKFNLIDSCACVLHFVD